jgi:hypothetical protein
MSPGNRKSLLLAFGVLLGGPLVLPKSEEARISEVARDKIFQTLKVNYRNSILRGSWNLEQWAMHCTAPIAQLCICSELLPREVFGGLMVNSTALHDCQSQLTPLNINININFAIQSVVQSDKRLIAILHNRTPNNFCSRRVLHAKGLHGIHGVGSLLRLAHHQPHRSLTPRNWNGHVLIRARQTYRNKPITIITWESHFLSLPWADLSARFR